MTWQGVPLSPPPEEGERDGARQDLGGDDEVAAVLQECSAGGGCGAGGGEDSGGDEQTLPVLCGTVKFHD
jgi:hypothetical protein